MIRGPIIYRRFCLTLFFTSLVQITRKAPAAHNLLYTLRALQLGPTFTRIYTVGRYEFAKRTYAAKNLVGMLRRTILRR
jgi:hypothetical protein